MPDAAATPISRFATTCKDVVAALRDGTIFALFVALLTAPGWVRDRLVGAGFTKGSIAGFEWQASLERARETAQRVSAAKRENENLAQEIAAIAATSQDPQVEQLKDRALAARSEILQAEALVKRDLSRQQEIVKAIEPEHAPLTGWLYLGAVDEAKAAWKPESPISIHAVPPALQPGQTLALRDDRYLRVDAASGNRAKAPVAGLVRSGERVEVLEVDHSHARAGGWFVWARVRALP